MKLGILAPLHLTRNTNMFYKLWISNKLSPARSIGTRQKTFPNLHPSLMDSGHVAMLIFNAFIENSENENQVVCTISFRYEKILGREIHQKHIYHLSNTKINEPGSFISQCIMYTSSLFDTAEP